ncbi:MAG: GntR family transcriptional regulator [Spirochaetaceae bacterium]|jgi:DNA-binding GntR family transcriptional regulator|nr:GntR family transcriptional regulator [Spirochaetaceae bacterium]
MVIYQQNSVQNSVYGALRKSIINLNLEPGASISEKEVSQKYNVSRTPVREAFIHLAKEGLIQVIPQRETLISRIDLERVNQEFFLRDVLESAVLEPFAARRQPRHVTELEACIELQEQALRDEDFAEFVLQDNAFHRVFFLGAGEPLAWDVLESQCGHYYRVRILTTWLTDIAVNVLAQHREILRAVKKNDVPAMCSLFHAHVYKLSNEESLLRKQFPSYFADPGAGDAFNVDFGGLSLGKH